MKSFASLSFHRYITRRLSWFLLNLIVIFTIIHDVSRLNDVKADDSTASTAIHPSVIHDFPSAADAVDAEEMMYWKIPPDQKKLRRYFELSALYWGGRAGRVSECLPYQQQHGWSFQSASFMTIGLEGSGHHLIDSLDYHATGHMRGGAYSFSSNGNSKSKKRAAYAWRLYSNASGDNPILSNASEARYLVIIRDPVDSFISSLRRFWQPTVSAVDTLQREWEQLQISMQRMNEEVKRIPCEQLVFLSYELLMNYPHEHKTILGYFLGLSTDNHRLINALLNYHGSHSQSHTFESFLDENIQEHEEQQRQHVKTLPLIRRIHDRKSFSFASMQYAADEQKNEMKNEMIWMYPFTFDCEDHRLNRMSTLLSSHDWPNNWQKVLCFNEYSKCFNEFRDQIERNIYSKEVHLFDLKPRAPMTRCHMAEA